MAATYVSVPTLEDIHPGIPGDPAAIPLVSEKFEDAKAYAGSAFEEANQYLEVLSVLFATAEMPKIDISYDFQEIALDAEIESKRPDPPSDEDMTPTIPTVPSMGVLESVIVPDVDVPVDDTGQLVTSFVYDEYPYSSQLADAVRAALLNYVTNGGTGLGADVEAAIWARAQARQDIQNERVYNEALAFFSSRGFDIPPGALVGRLSEALAEQTRANAQLNYEIMIEQARLAQDMTKHTLQVSVQFEGVEKQHASEIANRALEKAKSACDVIIRVYSAKVAAYAARVDAARTKAQVAEVTANVQMAKNTNTVDVYRAQVDAYRSQVAAELGIVESVAKVYGYKIAGYKADADVAISLLEAQIKVFEGKLQQATNQTTLSLKEAELTLNSYLGALALQEKAAEGGASVSAQLAASALNSVNASAALGYNVQRSRADGVSAQRSIAKSGRLDESHTYSHNAPIIA